MSTNTTAPAAATSTASRTPAPTKAPTKATPAKATSKPKASTQPCRCGCKAQTVRPEALYLPGHDARHAGTVGRAIIAATTPKQRNTLLASLPTENLKHKAMGMVKTAADRDAKKAAAVKAREAAKAAAKVAYDAALKANAA